MSEMFHTKPMRAAALAACCLIGLACACAFAGMAWASGSAAWSSGGASLSAASGPDAAYLTVYVQEGDSGTPRVAKCYTEDEFKALAPDRRDPVSGLYWEASGSTKVCTSAYYVTVDELVADAGIGRYYQDGTLVRAVQTASDGSQTTPLPGQQPTKAQLDAQSYFYGEVGPQEIYSDSGEKVPGVFSYLSASGEVGKKGTDEKTGERKSYDTAGETQGYLAQDSVQNRNNGTRFIWGISPDQLSSKSARGNRLWSNVDAVVFVVPDNPGADAAVRAANPLRVSTKLASVKAKKLKKKARALRPLAVKASAGKLSFAKAGGSGRLKVNAANGKVTVKKRTKKGTYKAKVRVTAAGDARYLPATTFVTVKVRVK